MQDIETAVSRHAFKRLFVDILHWDGVEDEVTVEASHGTVRLSVIARKSGITVLAGESPAEWLAHRTELRRIQRKIGKDYPEHILIFQCQAIRRQAWFTAVIGVQGRRVLRNTVDFESAAPPTRLLERLTKLTIPNVANSRIPISRTLNQIRTALELAPGCRRLCSDPGRNAESDRLALAVKRGEAGACLAFLKFHRTLILQTVRGVRRDLGLDMDDAEQITILLLLEAAHRFTPDRGYCFGYFAALTVFRNSYALGVETKLAIRMPSEVYWRCHRLAETSSTSIGPDDTHDSQILFESLRSAAGISREIWGHYCAVNEPIHLTELPPRERSRLKTPPTLDSDCAEDRLLYASVIHNALLCLRERHADILRRRYGMGTPRQSLEQIAKTLQISQQRVQQLQSLAEERLRRTLQKLSPNLWAEFRLTGNHGHVAKTGEIDCQF